MCKRLESCTEMGVGLQSGVLTSGTLVRDLVRPDPAECYEVRLSDVKGSQNPSGSSSPHGYS